MIIKRIPNAIVIFAILCTETAMINSQKVREDLHYSQQFILVAPFNCDFETDFCGFTPVNTGGAKWELYQNTRLRTGESIEKQTVT